jgi:hypothetical protein
MDPNIGLSQWKCGDSFFTKYSSCSFDRAAYDPTNPFNPLHPSITPYFPGKATKVDMSWAPQGPEISEESGSRGSAEPSSKHTPTSTSSTNGPSLPEPTSKSTVSPSTDTISPSRAKLQDGKVGEMVPLMPLSEVGKASRFGDRTLGANSKCNVFEVVLQTKEMTICPTCARSPKRARLPAHARGIFAPS